MINGKNYCESCDGFVFGQITKKTGVNDCYPLNAPGYGCFVWARLVGKSVSLTYLMLIYAA